MRLHGWQENPAETEILVFPSLSIWFIVFCLPSSPCATGHSCPTGLALCRASAEARS